LGWSPGDDQEIFMRREILDMGTVDMSKLAAQFTLECISKANAVFDTTKLEWMNQQYIMQLPRLKFKELLMPFIIKSGLMTAQEIEGNSDWIQNVCDLMQPRLKILSDIDKNGRFFFKDDFTYEQDAFNKHFNKKSLDIVKKFLVELQNIENFNAQKIELTLRGFVDEYKIKARDLIHPLRAFITGSSGGPPLFETLELIGKERCVKRINNILKEYGRFND
ncbi:hypothetical protein KAX97_03825, partial [candidate division WOR-3 bacterium]|nr:hypothetical protein [candidate division WOR-3 bacterium]